MQDKAKMRLHDLPTTTTTTTHQARILPLPPSPYRRIVFSQMNYLSPRRIYLSPSHYVTPDQYTLRKIIILPPYTFAKYIPPPTRPMNYSKNASINPQTQITFAISLCYSQTYISFAKCIFVPPDVYFWRNTLFYSHTYMSLSKCIILPSDEYF